MMFEIDDSINNVDHPPHYTSHPSGIECIEITEYFNFCLGNAIKYIWRHALKGNSVEDLKKARWYLDRELTRLERDERAEDLRRMRQATHSRSSG